MINELKKRTVLVIFTIPFLALILGSVRLQNNFPLTTQVLKAPLGFEHAIVVPYRNRTFHLSHFKESMGPYLQANFPNVFFSLWIVEQGDNELFNRGWLGNVGLTKIALGNPHVQCIIFHDVDLIPAADGVPYNHCDFPIRLGSELEHFDWEVPYEKYFGGIVSMHVDHWKKINGFSNDYIGWGGEDDDLYERVRINGLLDNSTGTVHRPEKGRGRFKTISQSIVHHSLGLRGETEYAHSLELLKEMANNSDRWKTDGLSDVHFTILEHTVEDSLPGFLSVHHITCVPLTRPEKLINT